MQTEHSFLLPKGLLSADGSLFREGVMRLATAQDEVFVLADPRVKTNRAYSAVLLLSRVVLRLGGLEGDEVTPEVVESLFSVDFAYLQDLYRKINEGEPPPETCPHCGKRLGE